MKIRLLFILLLTLGLSTFAQDRPELNTPNMLLFFESLNNGDEESMAKYIMQEIDANPKNGYAYSWLAYLYEYYQDGGSALKNADIALKYLPRKDKEYQMFAYNVKAVVYSDIMNEYDKAIEIYSLILSKYRQEDNATYKHRAKVYSKIGQYDLSDKDIRQALDIAPSDQECYLLLSQNDFYRGSYNEALEHASYAIKLNESNSNAYLLRAASYMRMEKFEEAAADVVYALSLDRSNSAWEYMTILADSSYLSISSRLKIQANKEPNDAYWDYALGVVNEKVHKYEKAIDNYNTGYKKDGSPLFQNRIARCQCDLGKYDDALVSINMAIDADSTDLEFRDIRAYIYDALGRPQLAIDDLSYCLSLAPENYYLYYRRGMTKSQSGDAEGAVDDFTMSITIEPSIARIYLERGKMFKQLGEPVLARKDFQRCVELDTVMATLSSAPFAYFYLGQHDKALQYLDTVLHYNPKDYYNACCIHSLVGNSKVAIEYLEKALADGYNDFAHIARDQDLDNIRYMPEFKSLIERYNILNDSKKGNADEGNYELRVVEVPFERKGSVTEVKCDINGLPLFFIFDTGAGDVTISSVEASFMFKNGYLSSKDVLGQQNYMTASGEVRQGTVINLNSVEIGGLKLNNVRASVVKSQYAPLLLGQSVLSRLGKIEIDNEKRLLKITHKERRP